MTTIVSVEMASSYGNKIGYTLKNRPDNNLATAYVVTTVYDKDGKEVGRFEELHESLAANKSAEASNILISAEGEWVTGKITVVESLGDSESLCEAVNFEFLPEDYANPDDEAGSNFGTVTSYMLNYSFANNVYKNEYYNRGGIYNTI